MGAERASFGSAGGERRRKIIAAAQRCVSQNGVHGTTVRDIAREADMSASTMYRYFGGKAEVLRYLAEGLARSEAAAARGLASRLQRASPRVREPGAVGPEPCIEHLWTLVQPPGGGAARAEDRLRTELWAEASRDPRVAAALHGGVEMVRQALQDAPDEATRRHRDADRQHALLLTAAFYGAHMLRSLEDARPERHRGTDARPPEHMPRRADGS